MKFGIAIRNMGPQSNRTTIRACARIAEQAGFDALFLSIIVHPARPDRRFRRTLPRRARHIGFHCRSDRENPARRFGAGRSLSARRVDCEAGRDDPGTIGQRMILGIGVGWMKPEFDALGSSFAVAERLPMKHST